VPPYTRGSASLPRGPGRKPGACLHTRKRISDGGQGESLVPPCTRGRVCISRGPGRKLVLPCTRGSVCVSRGPGRKLVLPCTRGSVCVSRGAGRKLVLPHIKQTRKPPAKFQGCFLNPKKWPSGVDRPKRGYKNEKGTCDVHCEPSRSTSYNQTKSSAQRPRRTEKGVRLKGS
jgi:hypothetical protein